MQIPGEIGVAPRVQVLTPYEEARCHVEAWPHYPDALMISNMIAGAASSLPSSPFTFVQCLLVVHMLSKQGTSCALVVLPMQQAARLATQRLRTLPDAASLLLYGNRLLCASMVPS